MPVAVVGGIIAGVGALAGGAIAAGGAKSAAQTQANAENQQLQLQQQIYNTNTQNFQPEINSGNTANTRLDQLLGLSNDPTTGKTYDPTSLLEQTPGYQFNVDQAMKGINANAYAAGMGNSGATYKALQAQAMNLANTNYNNYFNQVMDQANRGTTAKGAIAGVSENFGNASDNAIQNAANGISQSQATSGALLGSTLANIGKTMGTAYQSSYGAVANLGNSTGSLGNSVGSGGTGFDDGGAFG